MASAAESFLIRAVFLRYENEHDFDCSTIGACDDVERHDNDNVLNIKAQILALSIFVVIKHVYCITYIHCLSPFPNPVCILRNLHSLLFSFPQLSLDNGQITFLVTLLLPAQFAYCITHIHCCSSFPNPVCILRNLDLSLFSSPQPGLRVA